jgi:hypothetical protein
VVKLQVPENYSIINHGIFVKNSNKTKEVLDILKNQANQFLQNGMQHSTFMKMISQSPIWTFSNMVTKSLWDIFSILK